MIALTQGDPSGIGPDLTLRAWLARDTLDLPFAVFGSADLYAARAKLLGLDVPIVTCDCASAADRFETALPVVDTGRPVHGTPGTADIRDAEGTIGSIHQGAAAVHAGAACALVTNPITKQVLYSAGFEHPGHTEFLGILSQDLWGVRAKPVMLLWSEVLAVVPVTIHVPLRDVPELLTADLIVDTARIVSRDMIRRFGLAEPRLACAGLNPHAGEGGTLGQEETEVIAPALARLRNEGIAISGPFSADTMFHAEARGLYDVALTMYHDQGLIPIKTLSFDTGVNVTLGLPFVRTSPDHGTAYGLAGSGKANPASLIAALNLAARLSKADGHHQA